MKNFLTIIAAILLSIPAFAATDAMNYQAVIYNTDGTPAANKTIGLSVAILNGDVQVYSETATAQSDANGLVRHAITGIDGIDWSGSTYWLKVGIDPNGGSNYTILTQSEIMSVPTAAFARKSGDSDELRDLIYSNEAMTKTTLNEMYNNFAIIDSYLKDMTNRIENSASIDDVMALLEDYASIPYVQSQIYELKDYIDNIKIEGGDTEALENEIVDLRHFIENVNFKVDGAIKDIREYNDKIGDIDVAISDLERYVADNRARIEMLQSDNKDQLDKIGILEDTIAAQNEHISYLNEDIVYQSDRIASLEGMINALMKEVEDLKNMQ